MVLKGFTGRNFIKEYSEKDLVYQVGFEDGLVRPKVCVYAVDDKRGVVHVAEAVMGVVINTGFEFSGFGSQGRDKLFICRLSEISEFRVRGVITNAVYPLIDGRLETLVKVLADIHEQKKEEGFDVVRVSNPRQIYCALDIHAANYAKQFEGPADKMRGIFIEFINNNPMLFQY